MPQCQVVFVVTASTRLPLIQVLMIKGRAAGKNTLLSARLRLRLTSRCWTDGLTWNKGEQQTVSECGSVGDEDFQKQDDAGVSKLVEDCTGTERPKVVCCGFDDGACVCHSGTNQSAGSRAVSGHFIQLTDGIDDDHKDHERQAAKDIADFGVGWLNSSSNDGANHVDGSQERVLLEASSGIPL